MVNIYCRPDKLPVYQSKFGVRKAVIIGSGAVGTYEAAQLAQLGVGRITTIDMDYFSADNAAKHSPLIRTPEDIGRSKALATAERLGVLMIPGGKANGINANITMIGPYALEVYDAVFIALDNYAAKVYLNQQWLQIPQDKRPLLLMSGTFEELAQNNVLDGSGPCLRCLFDESWLKNGDVHTSCTGVQTRADETGKEQIVRTSGLASERAALDTVERFRRYVLGDAEIANKRQRYTPGGDPEYRITTPRSRRTCPDCRDYYPPEQRIPLPGFMPDTTLDTLFRLLREHLGREDFTVLTHQMEFNHITYGGVIRNDFCRHCGKPLSDLWVHESRTFEDDLLCDDCKAAHKKPRNDPNRPAGTALHALTPDNTNETARALSLFRLGWPIGGYIHVQVLPENASVLDCDPETYVFCLEGDRDLMYQTMTITEGGVEKHE